MPCGLMMPRTEDADMADPSTVEKGGAGFEGIKLLLREHPLPPIEEACMHF